MSMAQNGGRASSWMDDRLGQYWLNCERMTCKNSRLSAQLVKVVLRFATRI
jgi:hypothetical protein